MKQKTLWMVSFTCLCLFLVLIVIVSTVDVAAIGPKGTSVGLSGINGAVQRTIRSADPAEPNMTWYKISQILGYLALLTAAGFALLGIVQMIQRKSLAKVDRKLWALAGLYVVVLILYVLFEKVVVNCRPVLLPGTTEPAASFPSTHTMLAVTILGSALVLIPDYFREPKLRLAAKAAAIVLMAAIIISRILAGVHWATDILGGLLISLSLVSAFAATVRHMDENN